MQRSLLPGTTQGPFGWAAWIYLLTGNNLQGMASLGILIFLRVKLPVRFLIKERYNFLGMQSLKYNFWNRLILQPLAPLPASRDLSRSYGRAWGWVHEHNDIPRLKGFVVDN